MSIEDKLNIPKLSEALRQIEEQNLVKDRTPLDDSDVEVDIGDENENQADQYADALENVTDLKKALATMNEENFLENESRLEEIAQMAIQAHKDLLDAGFDVEARHSVNFFTPSMQALSIAGDAEKTKIERKLKSMKLKFEKERNEINKRRLELEEKRFYGNEEATVLDSNETFKADRNKLIEMLRDVKKETENK